MTPRWVCALALLLASSNANAQMASSDGRTRLDSDTSSSRRGLITRRDLAVVAGAVALTAATMPFEERIAHAIRFSAQPGLTRINSVAEGLVLLRSPELFVASGALYVYGRLADEHDVADMGLHSIAAVLLAGGTTWGLKGALGRASPAATDAQNATDFELGGGFGSPPRQSLPSGNTAVAFAAAAAIASETQRVWPRAARFVAPVMYGGASIVGVSWLAGNRHWASDVALGAGVGLFSGWKVVRFAHAHPDNVVDRLLLSFNVLPHPAGGGTVAVRVPIH